MSWREESRRGLDYEVAKDFGPLPADATSVWRGEGGQVLTFEDGQYWYAATSEGAVVDMLGPSDGPRLSSSSVYRFPSAIDRAAYLRSRGWDRVRSPTVVRSPPPQLHREALRALTSLGLGPDRIVFSPRIMAGLRDLDHVVMTGPLGMYRPFITVEELLADWAPRLILDRARGSVQLVTDRLLIHLTLREKRFTESRLWSLVSTAGARQWRPGQRLVIFDHAGQPGSSVAGWLTEPIKDHDAAQGWLSHHVCEDPLRVASALIPSQEMSIDINHSIAETQRAAAEWAVVTSDISQAIALAVKLGIGTIAKWGPYYVQASAGDPKFLHVEAVSSHFFRQDGDQLAESQEEALYALGWREPTHTQSMDNFWQDFDTHYDPGAVALLLATTLRTAFRAYPGQVSIS